MRIFEAPHSGRWHTQHHQSVSTFHISELATSTESRKLDETTHFTSHQDDPSSRLDRLNRIISEFNSPFAESGNANGHRQTASAGPKANFSEDWTFGQNGQQSSGIQSSVQDVENLHPDPELEHENHADEHPGHLFLTAQTKARYVSPAFFAMISKECSEISDLLRNQQRYTVSRSSSTRPPDTTYASQRRDSGYLSIEEEHLPGDIFMHVPAWSARDLHVEQFSIKSNAADGIVNDLPTPDQCHSLIQTYLAGYHTISPLFHSLSLWRQVKALFERYDELFVSYRTISNG